VSWSWRRDIGFLHALFGVRFNSYKNLTRKKKRPVKGPWYSWLFWESSAFKKVADLKKNWSAWFKKNWLVFTKGDSNWQDCDQCGITLVVCVDFRQKHQNRRRSSIIQVAEWEENIATLKWFVVWMSNKSLGWWPSSLGNSQLEKEIMTQEIGPWASGRPWPWVSLWAEALADLKGLPYKKTAISESRNKGYTMCIYVLCHYPHTQQATYSFGVQSLGWWLV